MNKRAKSGLVLVCLLAASGWLRGDNVPDTHIAIGLFYRRPLPAITIDSPSHSLICGGRPTLGPLTVSALDQKFLIIRFKNGEISKRQKAVFTASDSHGIILAHPDFKPRTYGGKVIVTPGEKGLSFVELLDFEDYLKPVVSKELQDCVFGLEDLKAQAVACRTFALANKGRHQTDHFDFCDTEHCQAYQGLEVASPRAIEAVSLTRGKILLFKGKPAFTYYHSTCGGALADVSDIWNSPKRPYLIFKRDAKEGPVFCETSPYYAWKSEISSQDLEEAFQKAGLLAAKERLKEITVVSLNASQHVAQVSVRGKTDHLLKGTEFWTLLGRILGWDVLQSTKFTVSRKRSVYTFRGLGRGHGVGLCQWGASQMAKQGYTYLEILRHYYPGTQMGQIKDRARLLKSAYSP